MSDRHIHCSSCSTYLGVIRDARLMKGIKYLCPTCITPDAFDEDVFANPKWNDSDIKTPGIEDVLGDLFKNVFGKK